MVREAGFDTGMRGLTGSRDGFTSMPLRLPSATLALLILLSLGCAQPLRTATRLSVACSMTAHFVDISTTMFAVGRGLGKELNPLLAPHIENAAAVGAFKGAVAVGANYPLLVLHESSPKLTLALGIGQCVGFSLIGAHNARVIRDAR